MPASPAAILTITTAARLPGAAALLRAMAGFHPGSPRFWLLVDPPAGASPELAGTQLRLDQGGPAMDNMRQWYEPQEYAAALKPAAIAALFAAGHARVLCLDPSMLALRPLDAALAGLADHAMLLLPLLTGPAGAAPERALREAGLFAGGCIGLADCPPARAWLGWWGERLFTGARADPRAPWAAPGQSWLDFAPGLVEGLHLLRDPAFGVCVGNLAARAPRRTDAGWLVGDAPLVLLEGRGGAAAAAEHAGLFALCPPAARPAGLAGFGQRADGRVPDPATRAALHAAIAAGRRDPRRPIPPDAPELDAREPDPLDPPPRFDPATPPPWPFVSELVADRAAADIGDWLGGCFTVELADGPAPATLMPATLMPATFMPATFMIDMQSALLWERRADLREHFPLRDAASLRAYLGWCLTRGVLEGGIDPGLFGPAWLDALCDIAADAPPDGPDDAPPASLAFRLTAPVGSVDPAAHALWFGWVAPALYGWPERLAAGVRRWLAQTQGTPPLSRGLVILWHLRADLRAAHDIATAPGRAGLLGWAGRHLATEYPAAPPISPIPTSPIPTSPIPAAPSPRRTRLLLTGQWSQPNGRGQDIRATAAALIAAGMDDFLIADRDLELLRGNDGGVLAPGPVRADINIVHCNADSAFEDALCLRRLGVAAGRVIGAWAWELEFLPRWWRHAFGFYDEIWAASRFAFDAFATERLRPVRLMRPPVCPPAGMVRFERARLGIPADATLFLASFDYRSFVARKNPDAVIAAFRAAFPAGDEPVFLLLKTQSAVADQRATHRLVRAARADPRIRLWDQVLAAEELAGLLEATDVYVSLHRSEGFGRGPAEALGAGAAVIATDYGGTTDFLNPGNARLVPARRVRVAGAEYVGVDGQSWAEPGVAEAAAAMAALARRPARVRRPINPVEEIGKELIEYLNNF